MGGLVTSCLSPRLSLVGWLGRQLPASTSTVPLIELLFGCLRKDTDEETISLVLGSHYNLLRGQAPTTTKGVVSLRSRVIIQTNSHGFEAHILIVVNITPSLLPPSASPSLLATTPSTHTLELRHEPQPCYLIQKWEVSTLCGTLEFMAGAVISF
ncbi:uncharacterized protein LAJ45_08471 [Morchella importuna]|uniref:uncharacterized protein n=1 Tax=Morchella importuna TaxID=1174673 RepID=UPI001E8D87BB|nr:uncharacterized protein LAJ45_08471 [Morchella importuna]KAH8147643.1 hypothetical protein LAJ45_08471 [Morchella importuna]